MSNDNYSLSSVNKFCERLLKFEEIFLFLSTELLQRILEKPLEKKAGRNFAPPGNKRLVYFIDDINMPMVSIMVT